MGIVYTILLPDLTCQPTCVLLDADQDFVPQVHGRYAVGWLSGLCYSSRSSLYFGANIFQYPWGSAHVVAPIVLGVVLLVSFFVWEGWFAPFPMFPKRLKQDPRILSLTLLITFISGANFFSFLMFWPTQAFNVYGHDPVMVGLRVLPGGLAIMVGACVTLWLLSVLRGRNKELMIVSCILMTSGKHRLFSPLLSLSFILLQ